MLRPRHSPAGGQRQIGLAPFALGRGVQHIGVDATAKRKWSQAYLADRSRRELGIKKSNTYRGDPHGTIVNWISAQSSPGMLPVFRRGGKEPIDDAAEARARRREALQGGDRQDRLLIDLSVPFCGDFLEANTWSKAELARYGHFLDKRTRMEKIEQHNIEEWIRSQTSD